MSGPKKLRPTIDAAIERAMHLSQSTGAYSILIILCCDGAISDITEVMEKVSQASFVPLSIVFVGIGDGDFRSLAEMNFESASLLAPSGNEFMRDVSSVVTLSSHNEDKEQGVHKVLEKVPSQIVQYNILNNILPPDPSRAETTQGEEICKDSQRAHAESLMETKKKSANDYGKVLRDSMADLDFGENPHTSEANGLEVSEESLQANAESSMENILMENESTNDYGKFLRDSMVDLDFDEDPHTSEVKRLESSNSEEDSDVENF